MALEAGDQPADVTVLGGGVIGLACARSLLTAGRSVRVVESHVRGSGPPRAASHGNCGLITPSHALPLNRPNVLPRVPGWMLSKRGPVHVAPRHAPALLSFGWRFARATRAEHVRRALVARGELLNRSRSLYDRWSAEAGLDCEWRGDGLLLVFSTQRAFEEELDGHELLQEHGVEVHALEPDELTAREPLLRTDLAGGVFYPGDAHLRPDRLVAELERHVREAGGRLEEGLEVTGFEREGERITGVACGAERFAVRDVVLAAGIWSRELLDSLGFSVPLQPAKGFTITIPPPARAPALPLILEEAALGVTPWQSGLRLAGRMEFAGLDGSAPDARFREMERAARRYLRDSPFEAEQAEEWFGYRPMTPDEIPLIGRVPRVANLILATGHGRLGVSMAPATGELVADLLTGAAPRIDPAPFRPGRFA